MPLDVSLPWLLWVIGIFLIAVAVLRVRDPFARLSDLDRVADNARRYDSWRGGRRTAADSGESGADVMRQLLRRQLLTWAGVGAVGMLLVLAGFVVR